MDEWLTSALNARDINLQDATEEIVRQMFSSLSIDKEHVRIRIADSGPGFDWREVKGKTISPTDTSGRGIYILSLYFDECHFNDSGNELELIRKIKRGDDL